MIEALWSVEFDPVLQTQSMGIIVFEMGRMFGGDGSVTYAGNYRVAGRRASAEIKVEKYANYPGVSSVAGMDRFTMVVGGDVDAQEMKFSGYIKEAPHVAMSFRLTRMAELATGPSPKG